MEMLLYFVGDLGFLNDVAEDIQLSLYAPLYGNQ